MSQPLIIRFTPVQQDYANVLRLFFLQRTGTRLSLGFLALAFGLIIFSIISQGTPPTIFEWIWLLLPPLFVYFVLVIQPSRVARQAAQNEQLVTETTWELSDGGLQISSSFGSTHLDWEDLNKLLTSKEYYLVLLKTNKNALRFIPRRAFTSPQEQDQFLEILTNHLQ